MISIHNKQDCCGCTACASICPQKCITMEPDEEGFLYPKVNTSLCINCHVCEKVCPVKNQNTVTIPIESIICQTKNKEDLLRCSSGGFFTALAKYVIEQKGVVYGVEVSDNNVIVHSRATSMSEVIKFNGSKYVQSNTCGIFQKIKADLLNGLLVLFSGTPCQVYGLQNFLGKKYDNLVTMDVLCHGASSPMLFQKYKESFKREIDTLNFRSKYYGYHHGTNFIVFKDQKKYRNSGRTDLFSKCFFSEITSRPSCYHCSFKGKHRASDFTVFDCWSFSKLNKERQIDNNMGYSNVLLNSQKAISLIKLIENRINKFTSIPSEAIEADGIMYQNSAIPHPKRPEFYAYLSNHSLNQTVKIFVPIHFYDKIIEYVKRFIFIRKHK